MIYEPAWETLRDAVKRVMNATGCTEEQAQTAICQAVADGTIAFRGQLKKHTTKQMTSSAVLKGADFEIRRMIKPADLDWEVSRPLKPWIVRTGHYSIPGPWELARIELCTNAVTSVLCAPQSAAARQASTPKASTVKSRPSFDRAKRAIGKLYPSGVPDQAVLPNYELIKSVLKELKDQVLPQVSDDTILRAAGRRK